MPRVTRVLRAPRFVAPAVALLVCLLTAAPAAAADPASADLTLDLRDASGYAGQSMSYGPSIINAGPDAATGVVVTVQLAPGLQVVSASGCSTSVSTSGSTVTCSVGSIPSGAGVALAWELRAAEPGTYVAAGSVTADTQDPAMANNSDSAQIVIGPSPADVSIDLRDASARAGEAFPYSFTVSNAGPGTATNVVATVVLPAGIDLVSAASCTQDGRIVTCSVGTMLARTVGIITSTLRAADAGTYAISGSVTADQSDTNTANNSDSATISVTSAADVAVAVSDSMDPVKPGQGVTYTTTVTNQGPSTATNVALSETWSASTSKDLSVGRVTTTAGTCTVAGMRLDCQLGTLASGDTATVTIALKPRGGGSVTLSASASATEFDADPANNSDTESTTVGPK